MGIIISLTGCSKQYSKDEIKELIKQVVRDVYSPKTMKQFKESYEKVVKSALVTKEAADSFYITHGNELTEADLKRSCYVDVLYSNKADNSEGRSHYLAKLQLHGADGEITTAGIFFYVAEGIDEEKETVIDRILIANIQKEAK